MAEPLLQVTQIRSLIGAKRDQRATVESLGLRRIRHTVTQPDRPEIRGMLAAVAHLVEVRYVDAEEALTLEPGQQPKGLSRRGRPRPAGGGSVADDAVEELREAEADALSVPGIAAAGSVGQRTPGLAPTAPVDRPDGPGGTLVDDEPEVGAPSTTADVAEDPAVDPTDDPRGDLARFTEAEAEAEDAEQAPEDQS